MQYQLITYWVKHFNGQFQSTNKATHFDIIAFYLGIPHGRSRWMWASAQTYKERRRKRNNNKLNHVWTTTASQVSWIFAMNSKLNRSSLYYWQQDMLIVFELFFMEPYWWTILSPPLTLLLRFKNNIQSAYIPSIPENTETWILCQSMVINEVCDHLSVIINWSSIGRCQSMLINNN